MYYICVIVKGPRPKLNSENKKTAAAAVVILNYAAGSVMTFVFK